MAIQLPDIKEIDISQIEQSNIIQYDGKYKIPPVIMSIVEGDKILPIMSIGSFSAWKGQAKGRKTTALTLIDSAYLSCPDLFLGKLITPATNGFILHFDTEQAPHETYKSLRRIASLTDGKIERLIMFYLRPFNPHERFDIITKLIEKYSESLELVIIDGILDLVTEMNSEEQATEITSWLLKMTEVHGIHIACVIHENYASEKASGHVGSYILRKAETIISVNKYKPDKKLSIIEPSFMRGEHFSPFLIGIDRNDLPYIEVTELECDF
jgi:hypothetical protein